MTGIELLGKMNESLLCFFFFDESRVCRISLGFKNIDLSLLVKAFGELLYFK